MNRHNYSTYYTPATILSLPKSILRSGEGVPPDHRTPSEPEPPTSSFDYIMANPPLESWSKSKKEQN